MKKIYLLISLLFANFYAKSQSVKEVLNNGNEISEEVSLLNDGYIILDPTTFSYMKFDLNGNLQWSKKFISSPIIYFNSVVQSTSGNLFILSEDASFNLYLIKLDSNGNITWTRKILRQEGNYTVSKIILDENENSFVMPSQGSQVSILKFDSNGNQLWSKSFYSDPGGKNPGFNISVTSDGGIIGTAKADSDIQIYLLDNNGNIVMNKRIGSDFSNYYYCHATIMKELSNNVFLTGGYFENPNGQLELLLMKVDEAGNIINSKTFFDPETLMNGYSYYPIDCEILSNGNIAVLYTDIYYGSGIYVSFFDQNLNFIQTIVNENASFNILNGYCGKYLRDDLLTLSFLDILTNTTNVSRLNLLNTNLNCGWVEKQNLIGQDYTFNPVNFSSNYTTTLSLNSVSVNINASNSTGFTYQTTCGVEESELSVEFDIELKDIAIYPNPAINFITIETEKTTNGTISIYNLQGEIVFESFQNSNSIDVSKFPPGMYLLQISDGNQIFTEKFIKE